MNIGYRKRVTALLFFLLLVRFWFSQTFEVTGPEAYAWMKGHQLDWGYWDQGPLVPWASWFGTLLFRNTELGVRLFAVNVYIVVGFLFFYIGRSMFNPRVGFYALILYLVLPIYAWQMLFLSEATFSVGFMGLGLIVFRHMFTRDVWWDWLLGGLIIAGATTLDWWNCLWAAGLFLFYMRDPQRTGRLMTPKTLMFLGTVALGILPFLAYRCAITGPAGLTLTYFPMIHPHQFRDNTHSITYFIRAQGIWLGPLGIVAMGFCFWIRRLGIPFFREHLLVLFLPIPGLIVQGILVMFGRGDQDVLAALWLPWLLLAAVIGARLIDQGSIRRGIVMVLVVASLSESLCGFWPHPTPDWWGFRFAPDPKRHPIENVAAEVARWQNETGASFLVTDSPQNASQLSFYLPLHAFVYIMPMEGIHSQYDLWANYNDFNGATAIFLSRNLTTPPGEMIREFAEIKTLHDIAIPEQAPWRLFLCEHFGASGPAGGESGVKN